MHVFRGIWPALITPGNTDNTVNVEALCDLLDYLLDKGVDGFYVGGSTGEGVFMPLAQRKLLAEAALKHVDGRVPVILHVGAISIDDATDLAHHGQEHGAAGISSIIPPMYNSLDAVASYYEQLTASAPDLPFMAYIIQPEIDPVTMMTRLQSIPSLCGTKYTGPNMYEFKQILDMGGGNWTMFSGMDEQCVYAAMMGGTGAIGSTLNIMPRVYRKIREHVANREYAEAQDLQVRSNRVIEAMISVGYIGALKEIISNMLGKSVGLPRLPRLPLTDAQRESLHKKLAETEFETLAAL